MSINCEVCNRGPSTTGEAVFRSGPKGGEPHWRCRLHLKKQPPAAVDDLVSIIENIRRHPEENESETPLFCRAAHEVVSAKPGIAELLSDLIQTVQRGGYYGKERTAILAHVAGLELKGEAYRADAERWQYVRQFDCVEIAYGEVVDLSVGSETDAGPRNDTAIDAARAKEATR